MKIYLIYPLFLCLYIFYYYKNLNKQPLFTINTLLKNIRIKVAKSYDSDSIEYHLLKKFHWLLMYNSSKVIENEDECNKKLKSYINHHQLLEKILTISPVLKQAYELKKYYLIFNSISTLDDTKENLVHIIQLYINSDIDSYR